MNMINRFPNLHELRRDGRVTVLYGPRRVGKTTLVNKYFDELECMGHRTKRVNSDNISVQNILSSQESTVLNAFVKGYDSLFIDEAQRIKNIGLNLKILIDANPDLNIVATGSASFDLANKLGEPLTGRQTPIQLFPISILELSKIHNDFELASDLENYILYGMYPDVLNTNDAAEKRFVLEELVNGYLLRDALELERVKSPKVLLDLLKLLAFQVGNEVSHSELASSLQIDKNTVARYLDILEKCFIIYNLRGFSRNLRSEITKTSKYYFYDTGILNAVISNFNELRLRPDVGNLWENFVIIERIKTQKYKQKHISNYFWRTWERQEIDLIEEADGHLNALEIKWNHQARAKVPHLWQREYGENSYYQKISPKNFLESIMGV